MTNFSRDQSGRWTTGVSGNPAGRPKGARDTYRRVRCESERTWDCRANLGVYADCGGPGRPAGSKNRSAQDRSRDAEEQAAALLISRQPMTWPRVARMSQVLEALTSTETVEDTSRED